MDVTIDTSDTGVVLGTRLVRLPIELTPRLHRQLAQWCRRTADTLDVAAIARGDVIEALLRLLVEDPTVSGSVRDLLAEVYAADAAPAPRRPLRSAG